MNSHAVAKASIPEAGVSRTQVLSVGDLAFALETKCLTKGDVRIGLTVHESKVLAALLLDAFTRDYVSARTLTTEISGKHSKDSINSLKVHLSKIRVKLGQAGSVVTIFNLPKVGYYFSNREDYAKLDVSAS
jgi:DNA-binding response OmpR family regulator